MPLANLQPDLSLPLASLEPAGRCCRGTRSPAPTLPITHRSAVLSRHSFLATAEASGEGGACRPPRWAVHASRFISNVNEPTEKPAFPAYRPLRYKYYTHCQAQIFDFSRLFFTTR